MYKSHKSIACLNLKCFLRGPFDFGNDGNMKYNIILLFLLTVNASIAAMKDSRMHLYFERKTNGIGDDFTGTMGRLSSLGQGHKVSSRHLDSESSRKTQAIEVRAKTATRNSPIDLDALISSIERAKSKATLAEKEAELEFFFERVEFDSNAGNFGPVGEQYHRIITMALESFRDLHPAVKASIERVLLDSGGPLYASQFGPSIYNRSNPIPVVDAQIALRKRGAASLFVAVQIAEIFTMERSPLSVKLRNKMIKSFQYTISTGSISYGTHSMYEVIRAFQNSMIHVDNLTKRGILESTAWLEGRTNFGLRFEHP